MTHNLANPLFFSRQINTVKSCSSWPVYASLCPCPFQYAGGTLTAVTWPSVTHYFTCFIFCEIEPLARIAWAAAPAVSKLWGTSSSFLSSNLIPTCFLEIAFLLEVGKGGCGCRWEQTRNVMAGKCRLEIKTMQKHVLKEPISLYLPLNQSCKQKWFSVWELETQRLLCWCKICNRRLIPSGICM